MDVHEGGIHAEGLQGSVQQVVGAAVNGILGNDMVARPGYSLDSIGDGRRAGGYRQGRPRRFPGRRAGSPAPLEWSW